MVPDVVIVVAGAATVAVSAHVAITLSVRIAGRLNLSDEFIGMTILAIGTSLPELVTHLMGSMKILSSPELLGDLSALVVGTNIGSDIFQQNLLVGVIAFMAGVQVERRHLTKDVGGLIAAALLLLAFSIGGEVSRLEGLVLVVLYVAYVSFLKGHGGEVQGLRKRRIRRGTLGSDVAALLGIFALMAAAANLMLDASVRIVARLPISGSFFGVVILGVAAAFPELAASLIAALEKKGAISSGILIGSNITNPMLALGGGAALSTYVVPEVVIVYDLPVKIVTAGLIFALFRRKETMGKGAGLFLIALYVAYVFGRNALFPRDF